MSVSYPTPFSNPLAKWIGSTCSESIFNVEVEPWDDTVEDVLNLVDELNILPPEERYERTTGAVYCTGFVVEEKKDAITIFTSAHCIDHAFTASKPICVQKVRELFQVKVLCEHHDNDFRKSKVKDKVRYYNPASVLEIDCSKDFLLLQIEPRCILGFNGRSCAQAHPALLPSPSPPRFI